MDWKLLREIETIYVFFIMLAIVVAIIIAAVILKDKYERKQEPQQDHGFSPGHPIDR